MSFQCASHFSCSLLPRIPISQNLDGSNDSTLIILPFICLVNALMNIVIRLIFINLQPKNLILKVVERTPVSLPAVNV